METIKPSIPKNSYSFHIEPEYHLMRLDTFVAAQFPTYSRSFFKKIITAGAIHVNGKIITKAATPLKRHDKVDVQFPQRASFDISNWDDSSIQLIAEHEHFFIIAKPAYLMVHQPTASSQEVTLVDWLVAKMPEVEQVGTHQRPGIVHRLDKDTSGLMIIARTDYGLSTLSALFKERRIQKIYHAVVHGHPPEQGTIEYPVGRHPTHKHKMHAFKHSSYMHKNRQAITQYTVLRYFKDAALLELKPLTGRTHQIRVHCAAVGHPIIGDQLYSNASTGAINRQALHAAELHFEFDAVAYSFKNPVPPDFQTLLSQFEK